jgi:CheY-like chemotaxis protein
VDPAQLHTALLNLTVNARDAMQDGGVLEIAARNDNLVEHAIDVEPGAYVKISVTDTGCGMTPEVIDRAFDPFFTTKDVGKGTGLGLSMVYGFVRQSRGHVTIQSTPSIGTTISLYLPRSSERLDANEPVVQVQKASKHSSRVLLVDDDDDVTEVTSAMLSKLGYRVVCARSGVEAIRILKSDKEFDLLLTDVFMPQGVNGIELAREARKICGGIKVLLASGNATDVLARYRIGDEFPIIGKPFARSELAQHLQSVMRAA